MADSGGGVIRDLILRIGFYVNDTGLLKTEGMIGNVISKTKKLAFVIAGTVGSMYAVAHATAEEAQELSNYSKIVGTAAGELQGLKDAANLADVSFESLAQGMRIFSRNIGSALDGSKEMNKNLQSVGIKSLKDQNGEWKTQTELLKEVSDAIVNTENKQKRVAMAMSMFGRGGAEMLPFLSEGSQKIEELLKVTDEYGYRFTQANIKAAESFDEAGKKLKIFTRGIRDSLGTAIIPYINQFYSFFLDGIKKSKKLLHDKISDLAIALRIAMQPLVIVAKTLFVFVNSVVSALGGWERVFNILIYYFTIMATLNVVGMVRRLANVILKTLIPALFKLNKALLPVRILTMLLVALGIAAYLVYDDFQHYLDGSESFIGHIEEKYPNAARILKFLGATFRLAAAIIISALRSIGDVLKIIEVAISKTIDMVLKLIAVFSEDFAKKIEKFFKDRNFGKMMDVTTQNMVALGSYYESENSRIGKIKSIENFINPQSKTSNNTLHTTVNISVPAGTIKENPEAFKKDMVQQINDVLQKQFKGIIAGNPAS